MKGRSSFALIALMVVLQFGVGTVAFSAELEFQDPREPQMAIFEECLADIIEFQMSMQGATGELFGQFIDWLRELIEEEEDPPIDYPSDDYYAEELQAPIKDAFPQGSFESSHEGHANGSDQAQEANDEPGGGAGGEGGDGGVDPEGWDCPEGTEPIFDEDGEQVACVGPNPEDPGGWKFCFPTDLGTICAKLKKVCDGNGENCYYKLWGIPFFEVRCTIEKEGENYKVSCRKKKFPWGWEDLDPVWYRFEQCEPGVWCVCLGDADPESGGEMECTPINPDEIPFLPDILPMFPGTPDLDPPDPPGEECIEAEIEFLSQQGGFRFALE